MKKRLKKNRWPILMKAIEMRISQGIILPVSMFLHFCIFKTIALIRFMSWY